MVHGSRLTKIKGEAISIKANKNPGSDFATLAAFKVYRLLTEHFLFRG